MESEGLVGRGRVEGAGPASVADRVSNIRRCGNGEGRGGREGGG